MKYENLGPVTNPDGSPSDLTRAMLEGTGRDPDAFVEPRPLGRAKVRVRVIVEVEVDRDGYDAEYGERASVDDIRRHIKGAVGTAAVSGFEHIDSIEVTDWS